jgi:imidazolonepropionase-like amidohydrolase
MVHTFKTGWLIDGRGGPIQKNMSIVVHRGIIAAIQPAAEISEKSADPGDDLDIDLSNYTVMPGLIDAHVHLSMSGNTDPDVRQHQLEAGYEEKQPVIRRHIDQHWAAGVVAVRDGGDRENSIGRFLESRTTSRPVLVRHPGQAWHAAGRYGGLIGRPPRTRQTLGAAIRECRDQLDFVKIVNSGLNSLETVGRVTPPQFPPEELKTAVDNAKKKGLMTMVHANGEAPVRESLAAGCHSIEHGFFMGAANLERMASSGSIWVPTAVTMKAYARMARPGSRERDVAQKNLDSQLEQVRRARELGVTVALGTDAGSLGVHHGTAAANELRLLMTAGLSLPEAVRCAAREHTSGSRLPALLVRIAPRPVVERD